MEIKLRSSISYCTASLESLSRTFELICLPFHPVTIPIMQKVLLKLICLLVFTKTQYPAIKKTHVFALLFHFIHRHLTLLAPFLFSYSPHAD